MDPVHTAWMDLVYRGTTPDVGDLWCKRIERGHIVALFKPSDEELAVLNAGGAVLVGVLTEPLPPLQVIVMPPEDSVAVAPHPFKVIPELEDKERG